MMFDSLLELRSWWAANTGGQAPQEVQVKSGPGYKAYVRSLCKIRLGKDESSYKSISAMFLQGISLTEGIAPFANEVRQGRDPRGRGRWAGIT